MINTELRLHGQIDDSIEYFATAAGGQTLRSQFYQQNGESTTKEQPRDAWGK